MKETILRKNNKLPYSLHDMKIEEIKIENNNIILIFKDGFVKEEKPYEKVKGKIIIKDVDYDFSMIYILSENGEYGNFNGEKLEIEDFLNKYKKYSFEVIDELYGYNQVYYSGFLSTNKNEFECNISIYYIGDLVYITEE